MEIALLTGRILFSLIFIFSAPGHFKQGTIAFAASKGVPLASVMVPFSGIMELVGGISILIGYEARIGAWLIVLFMLPVTFVLHAFWKIKDPMQKQMEMATFLKNISIMGGALILTYFGSGELSIN
ncbi:MAG TPA: DoxX family protein [Chitinophagaceae bacterium]|jgi:putative oxidoreductase|nr:DoxX family protein [Chitinophagaceae bacterium]